MRISIILAVLFLTSACVSNDFHHAIEREIQGEITKIPTPPLIEKDIFKPIDLPKSDIFSLEPEQRERFLAYYNNIENSDVRPHKRVANFIEEFSHGFSYLGDTVNAVTAFSDKNGNCLSLAILSTAFAKEAGLGYQYNKVHSAPIYQEYGNVQLVSTHVNLTIFAQTETVGDYVLGGAITIDYFRTKDSYISDEVTSDELQVMYWNNLASEAIIAGNLDLAFAYAIEANNINPLYPETLNLLAILYKRKENVDLAYQVYDFMDKNSIVSFSAMDNFAKLLFETGDFKRAAELRSKIQHIIDDNPYTWLARGIQHFENGEYNMAERFLLRSSTYGPYLHEPLYNLARLYVKQNRFKKARTALIKAKELAHMPDDEKRYQAKLFSLNQ
ncbi:MAG: tetratricopeptide (TPR) repeat protein [Glaciecola sp.]|jgi:tetratricopeptide (TPR) repeat protein